MRDIEAVGLTAGHIIETCIVAPIQSLPLFLHRRCEGGRLAPPDVDQDNCRSDKSKHGVKEAGKGWLMLNSTSFIVIVAFWVSKQAIILGMDMDAFSALSPLFQGVFT